MHRSGFIRGLYGGPKLSVNPGLTTVLPGPMLTFHLFDSLFIVLPSIGNVFY